MPPLVILTLIAGYVALRLYRKELETLVIRFVRWVMEQVKPPRQPLLTAAEHAEQADRVIRLHQYTQRICDALGCDHVSVYASKNGEYLKNHDSIEKLIMLSEAIPHAAADGGRYMQSKREVHTADLPNLWLAVCQNSYVLRQEGEAKDEFTNRTMRQRGYLSLVCVQITSPLPGGQRLVLGMFSCSWKNFHLMPVGAEAPDGKPCAHLTPQLERTLLTFRTGLSDLMSGSTLPL